MYGQGVSYWYSAGFLLDSAGNDTYRVHQYGQGSGIHLSLGLLADGAGDELVVYRCDLDAGQSYKRTTFNFAVHRQPDQYRMIVERKGAMDP